MVFYLLHLTPPDVTFLTGVTVWVSGYIVSGRTTAQKTHPLLGSGRPLLLFTLWNVCTESLLNNGHGADPHRKHFLQQLFYYCVRVLRLLFSSGSALLLVAYFLRSSLQSP
jgi:hypothetical protein